MRIAIHGYPIPFVAWSRGAGAVAAVYVQGKGDNHFFLDWSGPSFRLPEDWEAQLEAGSAHLDETALLARTAGFMAGLCRPPLDPDESDAEWMVGYRAALEARDDRTLRYKGYRASPGYYPLHEGEIPLDELE